MPTSEQRNLRRGRAQFITYEMYYTLDMKYKEIAEFLHLTLDGVKYRIKMERKRRLKKRKSNEQSS